MKNYPRAVSGRYSNLRSTILILTQIIYCGLPWINWDDHQAVLLDFYRNKILFFGSEFSTFTFFNFFLIFVLCLFVASAILGRIFCGFICPESIYTQIFVWIERKLEGDWLARMRLDAQSWAWNVTKIRIKLTKHFIYILISAWTGLIFIGYLFPIRNLFFSLAHFQIESYSYYWFLFYGFLTWINAGFLRDQFCKHVCPYLRIHQLTFNRFTCLVIYDYFRGEPRGGRSRRMDHTKLGLGDCVNCDICVQSCPMGIDIRKGFNRSCTDCGVCIDACDKVMLKMKYRPGLIRYTTRKCFESKEDSNNGSCF